MWSRRVAVILAIALVAGMGFSTVFRSGPHQFGNYEWGSQAHRTDYTVYREAARAVWEGRNIYEVESIRGWLYHYLPVFAVVMVPFAWINVFWGSLVWYLLSVAMFAHTVFLAVSMARKFFPSGKLDRFWLTVLVALITLAPAMSALTRGQASVTATYLTTLAVWFYLQRRVWPAGFCLAGAVAIKVFPALLLVYFAGKRRWNMLGTSLVALVVFILIVPSFAFGFQGNLELLDQWVHKVAMPAGRTDFDKESPRYTQLLDPRVPKNQSVQAVTTRWLAGGTEATARPEREPLARRVALVLNAGLALCAIFVCRKKTASPDEARTLLEMCIVIMLALFVSPVTWSHYMTLFALPAAVALAQAANGTESRWWRLGIWFYAVASIAAFIVAPLQILGLLLFGGLVLWAVFVRAVCCRGGL